MADKKDDVRVQVRTEESNHGHGDVYLVVHASLVTVEDGALRHYYSGDPRNSIGVRGQMGAETGRTHGYDADFYGVDVELRDFTGSLYTASPAVKELARIVRHMDRHAERFGYAPDTTEHLARLAAAVGANATTPFVRRTGTSWSDDSFVSMRANDLRWFLKDTVRKWADKNHLVPQAEAS